MTVQQQKGAGLIEIIIAVFVVSATFFGVLQVSTLALKATGERNDKAKALVYAQEAIEAVRNVRDGGWTANIAPLSFGSTYYVTTSGNAWSLTQTNPGLLENKFTRTVVIDNVSRDINDNIVSSGGTNDPSTKKVTVTVGWGSSQVQDVSYTGGTTDADIISFPANSGWGDPAQSFTVGAQNISVPRVDLYLKKVGTPSNVYLEIRSGSTVGALLGTSAAVAQASLPASLGWVSFSFASPVALSANTQYYLRLRSTPDSGIAFSGAQSAVWWGYLQTGPSPYAGGSAYRYVNQNNGGGAGQILTQYDFSFQVFSSAGIAKSVQLTTYLMNILKN